MPASLTTGTAGTRTLSTPGVDAAAGTALVVFWSSGFVGARLGSDHAGPDTLLAWRLLISALLLLAWYVVRRHRCAVPRPRLSRTEWAQHIAIGTLTQALYLGGVFGGIAAGVPAGTAALIAALQPLVVANAASRLLSHRVSNRQRIGLWLGLAGVPVVVADDLAIAGTPAWAYLLPLGAMLALSTGTILDRRWRPTGGTADTLTIHVTTAAVLVVVGTLTFGEITPPASSGFLWAIAWVVILSGFGGYGLYLLVLRRNGATHASVLLYLTPPTTLLWSWAMFGEGIGPRGLAGLVLCAVAVWLAIPRRPANS